MVIEPNLTKEEALKLADRLHKKVKNLDWECASERHTFAQIPRTELWELVDGLEKLKIRMEYAL